MAQVKAVDAALHHALILLEDFAHLLRTRPHAQPGACLEDWLTAADSSGLPEFTASVRRLRQDLSAVVAGFSLPWSEGQTEGQIHKLILLKRSMCGRSSFGLLRQRTLYTSGAA